jgi:hypothetical protein
MIHENETLIQAGQQYLLCRGIRDIHHKLCASINRQVEIRLVLQWLLGGCSFFSGRRLISVGKSRAQDLCVDKIVIALEADNIDELVVALFLVRVVKLDILDPLHFVGHGGNVKFNHLIRVEILWLRWIWRWLRFVSAAPKGQDENHSQDNRESQETNSSIDKELLLSRPLSCKNSMLVVIPVQGTSLQVRCI